MNICNHALKDLTRIKTQIALDWAKHADTVMEAGVPVSIMDIEQDIKRLVADIESLSEYHTEE
jgi:hypothetical protein